MNPQHFKATFNRGFAYDKLGFIDKAVRDYRQALTIEPNNSFCYYNLGISLDKKGFPEEAVLLLTFRFIIFQRPSGWTLQKLTSTAIEGSPIEN